MNTFERHDIYRLIHKGLRLRMAEALQMLGTADTGDAAEFGAVADDVLTLLEICQSHVEHENAHVHPALEARAPGSSADIAGQHVHHEQELARLIGRLREIRRADRLERPNLLRRYYRDFALWVADNFVHMEQEEREHNAILWAHYSDEEIVAIEQALVADITPEMLPITTRIMLRAMNPDERADFLGQMRPQVPAAVFDATVAALAPGLSAAHRQKLARALGRSPLAKAG